MVQHGVRDLEAFAAHARRRSIAPEDVLLLCRHSPALHSATEHSKPTSARKSRAFSVQNFGAAAGAPKKRKH
ncbi:hypothetical protein DIPPA_07385 [Diplonema papillatum]|nr:hypothetical protein DIPPA_07385 [Diplonema papillatum]